MSTPIKSIEQVHPDRDFVLFKEIKKYVAVDIDGKPSEIPVDEAQEIEGGLLVVRGAGQNFGHTGGAVQGSEVRMSQRNPHYLILRVGPGARAQGFEEGQVRVHDAHYERTSLMLVNGEEYGLTPCEAFIARLTPEMQPSITDEQGEN